MIETFIHHSKPGLPPAGKPSSATPVFPPKSFVLGVQLVGRQLAGALLASKGRERVADVASVRCLQINQTPRAKTNDDPAFPSGGRVRRGDRLR
jgi:hypothetical protein